MGRHDFGLHFFIKFLLLSLRAKHESSIIGLSPGAEGWHSNEIPLSECFIDVPGKEENPLLKAAG